ncbi:hypothetical protein C8A03DRAFT_16011 [Achaetomium macrosporum]|uniref:CENP-V/GFA domain-containing protein n=1 Tax=Achaetomium macrosporum TaxID=79813 RepID=A0AAN7HA73_9PEZI|nr:hypothetical protein C8A03DRAFT_16011 [Achaetomium macrosporum]
MAPSFPTPNVITGSCLCGCLRYRVDLPANHNFETFAPHNACQCTQFRKQIVPLFFAAHMVAPASTAFRFTTPTTTLQTYRASDAGERVICTECWSFICRKPTNKENDFVCFTLGTVDPLYLFNEGADGAELPHDGFGLALANGSGQHFWCRNEIKGLRMGLSCSAKGGAGGVWWA